MSDTVTPDMLADALRQALDSRDEAGADLLRRWDAQPKDAERWRCTNCGTVDEVEPSDDGLCCAVCGRASLAVVDLDAALAEVARLKAVLDTEEHDSINYEVVREIRALTDASGAAGVPFLDDAVQRIVNERGAALARATTAEAEVARLRVVRDAATAEVVAHSCQADHTNDEPCRVALPGEPEEWCWACKINKALVEADKAVT